MKTDRLKNGSSRVARSLVLAVTIVLFLIFGQEALAEWPASGGIMGHESTGSFLWDWIVAFLTLGLSCLFAWGSHGNGGPDRRRI